MKSSDPAPLPPNLERAPDTENIVEDKRYNVYAMHWRLFSALEDILSALVDTISALEVVQCIGEISSVHFGFIMSALRDIMICVCVFVGIS